MNLTKKQKEIQAHILDVIYVRGPISRIDIAHETGITPATVSSTTAYLIEDGLIEEIGEANVSGSGRRKILLDIQQEHQYFVGVELSEQFISFCLTDNKSNILKQEIREIDEGKRIEILTTENIGTLIHTFIEELEEIEVSAIGVALPGHHTIKDNLFLTNNPLWKNIDLNELDEASEIPMYFENNVKSMLIYRRFFGESTADENFILHHISRGIFCAYMYNGELYAEENRLVGEVGHTTIQMDGELCECGNHGCLQTFTGETWLIRKAQYIYETVDSTYLNDIVNDASEMTFQTILTAYKLGDPLIINLLENAIKAIATNIINLSMMIDAQTIYIHGSIYQEPTLLKRLESIIDTRQPLFKYENQPVIKVLPYKRINGALGASALCISETYAKP